MRRRGQGILEYLLLTALVAFVCLLSFRTGLVNRAVEASNEYFKTGSRAIMGGYFDSAGEAILENPNAVNGGWCAFTKCINGVQIRECACPRPSFGGVPCAGAPVQACGGTPPAHACPPGMILIPGYGCGYPAAPGGGLSCGDGLCSLSENSATCPADCASGAVCGNGICEFGETTGSCPADCKDPLYCGDAVCTAGLEDCRTCALDCGACSPSGNGICDPGENCNTHPTDCLCFAGQTCYDSGSGFTCCTRNANRCGSDGCGGTHPVCQAGANCVGGSCICTYTPCDGVCCAQNENCYPDASGIPQCCMPNCAGKCGGASDGCGGTCLANACVGREVCNVNVCCDPGTDTPCDKKCGGYDAGCGIICNGVCGVAGEVCYLGQCCDRGTNCANRCNGVGDGCGGSCPMDCPSGMQCNLLTDFCCIPNCAGKNCGDDDSCGGQCQGSCSLPPQCNIDQLSVDSVCVKTGPRTAACQYVNSTTCPDGCNAAKTACCVPDCTGKACGDSDGCIKTCQTGPCTSAPTCVSSVAYSARSCSSGSCVYDPGTACPYGCLGNVCAPCTPSCVGKCGGEDDGCGSPCPVVSCAVSTYCVGGSCVCGPPLAYEIVSGVCTPSCGSLNAATGRAGVCTVGICPLGTENLGATFDCNNCCAPLLPGTCNFDSECPPPYCIDATNLGKYSCISHSCVGGWAIGCAIGCLLGTCW